MAKGKDFSRSLGSKRMNTLIPVDNELSQKEGEKKIKSRPKEVPSKSTTTVTTFRIENEKLLAIKAVAFWDRKKIQDVFDEALKEYLASIDDSNLQKAIAEYKKRNNL